MRRFHFPPSTFHFFTVVAVLLLASSAFAGSPPGYELPTDERGLFPAGDLELINPTFLGSGQRNYYGNRAPGELGTVWRHYLGEGDTRISKKKGVRTWAGAGFTGQPLLVREGERLFIIQGAFDHNLKKIDAANGKLVWQYGFDDVIKGTGTLWLNPDPANMEEQLIIMQGSRLGLDTDFRSKIIPSYRGVSYFSGEELWRMNVSWTDSYSRDVDGSALVVDGTAYIGLENSLFTVFDPAPRRASLRSGLFQPKIFRQLKLYRKQDVEDHRYNIVTESSPTYLDGRIYVPSGSGRVWGYDMASARLDWEFYVGSDIDGSAPATSDGGILVTVEKQYIKGRGGTFKFDPSRTPEEAVKWYFPVNDKKFNTWEGGIIGSPAVNDLYPESSWGKLAAFMGVDGYLYVVQHDQVEEGITVDGPREENKYPTPRLVYRHEVGPSISTPIFVGDKLIAASYHGLYLFQYDEQLNFTLLDTRPYVFEATPVAHNGRIYVASRNGYLYCFGDLENK
jgi:outer membrane protein assembly factor BamB